MTVTLPTVGDSPEPVTFGPITRTDIVRYAILQNWLQDN